MIGELIGASGGDAGAGRGIREWVGIGVSVWIAYAISAGIHELRDLRMQADAAQVRITRIEASVAEHSRSANDANLALARILGIIDSRLARLEGAEEARADGRTAD